MALYATETVMIATQARDYFSAEVLDSGDVSATITIWDIDGETKLVDEEAMTYDATLEDTTWDDPGAFFYIWESEDTAGAYPAKIVMTGTNISAFEYKTVRLRAKKAFDT